MAAIVSVVLHVVLRYALQGCSVERTMAILRSHTKTCVVSSLNGVGGVERRARHVTLTVAAIVSAVRELC